MAARDKMMKGAAAAWCAALVLGGAAEALQPARLVDAELNAVEVELVGADAERISFFDAGGNLRRERAAGYISIEILRETAGESRTPTQADGGVTAPARPSAATEETVWPHLIELTDGHVLRGRRVGVDAEGRVLFETAAAGMLALELDRVRRLILDEEAVRLAAERIGGLSALVPIGSDDRVVMRNADTLGGFIDSLTADAVVLESGGRSLPLSWDAISLLMLPNPATRPPGIWARLTDGARIRLEQIAFDDDGLTGLAFGDRPVAVEAAAVAAIDYAERRQLVRLGELEIASISAGRVFGVRFEPVIAAETASLHAPFHAEFSLPPGAVRFVAEATLADDPSGWADVEVIVSDGRGELARRRLNGDRPSASISVQPRDGRLVIELDSGVNGPVMDRVRLSGAYVLVEN